MGNSKLKKIYLMENTMSDYYVYILANKSNSTIYIGYTYNLEKRLYEHRNHVVEGFTDKYNCTKLVYYEYLDDKYEALSREKQLKRWSRDKKNNLINSINPKWRDLFLDWYR